MRGLIHNGVIKKAIESKLLTIKPVIIYYQMKFEKPKTSVSVKEVTKDANEVMNAISGHPGYYLEYKQDGKVKNVLHNQTSSSKHNYFKSPCILKTKKEKVCSMTNVVICGDKEDVDSMFSCNPVRKDKLNLESSALVDDYANSMENHSDTSINFIHISQDKIDINESILREVITPDDAENN